MILDVWYSKHMKTVQLTNNPPVPEFKGISVSIQDAQQLQLKFYKVIEEKDDTIYAEVTSAIGMTIEQWGQLKQIIDDEISNSQASK
jgi:hypothetical protein